MIVFCLFTDWGSMVTVNQEACLAYLESLAFLASSGRAAKRNLVAAALGERVLNSTCHMGSSTRHLRAHTSNYSQICICLLIQRTCISMS